MNEELKELKIQYESVPGLRGDSETKYVAALEEEVELLEELFETRVADLEEMNKTQAADISRLIAEKHEKQNFVGRLLRRK